MTPVNVEQMEKEVLYEYENVRRERQRVYVRISQIADSLEELVKGLRCHPSKVTPTPEVNGPDYKVGLDLLLAREEVIELCKEAASLQYRFENAQKRKAALGF
jgi:hypothetical protein